MNIILIEIRRKCDVYIFTDRIIIIVYFLPKNLCPIMESQKHTDSTSPINNNAAKIQCTTYNSLLDNT